MRTRLVPGIETRTARRRSEPLRLGLAALAASLLLVDARPSIAATLTCPSGDVSCLIAAINFANQMQDSDTILLGAGTYSIALANNSQFGGNALPVITSPITILGAGMFATRIERSAFATDKFRIFLVTTGNLTLGSLTIANGATKPAIDEAGGGGLFSQGHATLANVAFEGNSDTLSAASLAAGGGAVANLFAIDIRGCLFENNSSNGPGGAILNRQSMSITRSSIRNNTGSDGGGIANLSDHESTISSCDILNNHGSITGGIQVKNSVQSLLIIGSTIAGNGATGGQSGGGGITLRAGNTDIASCTISDNFNLLGAVGNAGGMLVESGAVVRMTNTILARNVRFTRLLQFPQDCVGAPLSFGHNVVGDTAGCSIALLSSDFLGNPGLGTLADAKSADGFLQGNGVVPLVVGSLAIDGGDSGSCLSADQLGFPRADGDLNGSATCDIGAVEFEPVVSSIIAMTSTQTVHDQKPPSRDFPAGKDTITRQYKNKSSEQITHPVFVVSQLTNGNMLLNADPPAPGGVGAMLTPNVGPDLIWSPNEIITVTFSIGLHTEGNYKFTVDEMGYPQ